MFHPRRLNGVRIGIVLRSLALGGAERQAVLVANGLDELAGARVAVWAFEPGDRVPKLLRPEIDVIVQHPGSEGSSVARLRQLLGFVERLRRARFDILVPFTDHPNRVVGAVWPLTGAAAAVWNQRDEGREVTGRPLERIALRTVRCFVANSEAGREFLVDRMKVDGGRITLIPNGVQLEPPRLGFDRWRSKLGVDEKTSVTVMLASLSSKKDHDTLLSAWSIVVSAVTPPPVLVLAGRLADSADRVLDRIAELGVGDAVRVLGEVEDVSGLLAAADLAVFSSFLEGCPNGVLEPMAAGLPVIATRITGTSEALGATYPWLVPERDPRALAAGILDALDRTEAARSIGVRNRQRCRALFSAEAAVRRWAELVTQLVSTP